MVPGSICHDPTVQYSILGKEAIQSGLFKLLTFAMQSFMSGGGCLGFPVPNSRFILQVNLRVC